MSCQRAVPLIVDHARDALRAEDSAALSRHLSTCARCRAEAEAARALWLRLGDLPDEAPSEQLRGRFYTMLEGYRAGLEAAPATISWRQALSRLLARWWPERPALQLAISAAALVLGVVLGMRLDPGGQARPELDRLQSEVASLNRLVSLSLLERGSASDRLRGVAYAQRSADLDGEALDTLLATASDDPSVNVRLAAIDALARFVDRPAVRTGLVEALERPQPPLVQVAVVDALLTGDAAARDAARRLDENTLLDDAVRHHLDRRFAVQTL